LYKPEYRGSRMTLRSIIKKFEEVKTLEQQYTEYYLDGARLPIFYSQVQKFSAQERQRLREPDFVDFVNDVEEKYIRHVVGAFSEVLKIDSQSKNLPIGINEITKQQLTVAQVYREGVDKFSTETTKVLGKKISENLVKLLHQNVAFRILNQLAEELLE